MQSAKNNPRFYREVVEEMFELKLISEARFNELCALDEEKLRSTVTTKELISIAVQWRVTKSAQ